MKLNLDDSKITAYALGELSGFEKEMVEEFLRTSPEATTRVEEIRQVGDLLNASFPISSKLGATAVRKRSEAS